MVISVILIQELSLALHAKKNNIALLFYIWDRYIVRKIAQFSNQTVIFRYSFSDHILLIH